MARGPKYKVPRRRRREGKTNYYKRYIMVLSGKLRFVVRRTLNHIIVQVVKFHPKGDITLVAAHSRELVKKYGWKGATDNLPAAYLTGFLAGLRALKAGIKYAVPDIGLHKFTPCCRIFAAIKGGIDAGLEIPLGIHKIFEDEDKLEYCLKYRIPGQHIADYASKLLSENPELFEKRFSKYLSREFDPRNLPNHFRETLLKICKDYGLSEDVCSELPRLPGKEEEGE